MALVLVSLLAVTGVSLYHLVFSERVTASQVVDDNGAFYLGNAGIERGREVFKFAVIPATGQPSWTSVLDGSSAASGYPAENPPNALLCPPAAQNRGCVIPPFQVGLANPAVPQDPAIGTDYVSPGDAPGIPFSGTFVNGLYSVRAFNNGGPLDVGTTDGDGIITLRAVGFIRGEEKILEANVQAALGGGHINCKDPCVDSNGDGIPDCPESEPGNPVYVTSEGRQPGCFSSLPALDFPLTDPQNYYRPEKQAEHFPAYTQTTFPDGTTFTGTIPSNSYYFITGDATFQNVSGTNVVIFATGYLDIKTGADLTNAIVIGVTGIQLHGTPRIRTPSPIYPAMISGGDIDSSGSGAEIQGNVWAGNGEINFNPVTVRGVLYGNDVEAQGGSGTLYSDQDEFGATPYYVFMLGFTYPNSWLVANTVQGTWRELK